MVLQRHVQDESRGESRTDVRPATASVAVVVPWRGGCAHRERAWKFLRPRYEWPVIEAPGPEPWCKAASVAPAVEATAADIVVVADADVWCDGLAAAVGAVAGGAPWAIPHHRVHRLTEDATRNTLAGREDYRTEQIPYPGIPGGGIVVAPRGVIRSIPLDSRFVGWGQEDESWGWALAALVGLPWRGDADLIHFWHPPQQRLTRARGSFESWELRRRYAKARHDPVTLRALIEEGRRDLDAAPQPGGHDHAPHRERAA